MKKEKVYFNNKNGELTIEEIIKIKHSGKQSEWIKNFRTTVHKCPPKELRMSQCFYCSECWNTAFEMIHECQNYYKVGKDKYYKDKL